MAEVTRDVPLEAGYQHTFSINNVDIPDEFANSHVYSWGLKIDYADEINETYEDDNLLWSNDGWQLSAGVGSADVVQRGSRMGSTRPFSHNQSIERSLSSMNAGDEPLATYNGPSIFRRPDFCNNHRK